MKIVKFVARVDESKCTYCGACNNICPARAVLFEREFEVSQ